MYERDRHGSDVPIYSRVNKETESYTLTQLTEIIRGQADAILKRATELQRLLGRGPIEKDTGHPERSHTSPGDILLNAKDDMHRAELVLTELIGYIGEPGDTTAADVPRPPRVEGRANAATVRGEEWTR